MNPDNTTTRDTNYPTPEAQSLLTEYGVQVDLQGEPVDGQYTLSDF